MDDAVIATETLNRPAPETFMDVAYPVPVVLTRDKASVRITFRAHPGNMAGGVFGLRVALVRD